MTSQAVYCLSLQIRPPSDENNDGLITANQKDTSKNSMSNKITNLDKLSSSTSTSTAGIDIEVKNSTKSTYKLNNRNKSIQIHQQQKHNQQQQYTSTSIGTSTTSSSSSSTSLTKNLNIHHHQIQQQQQQQQQHHQLNQHSNIILVRGARTENGQIILQNSHELLSLLNGATTATIQQQQQQQNDNNDDNNKSIILQHQRIKTTTTSTSTQSGSGLTKIQCDSNNTIGTGGSAGTVLLQSTTNFNKKNLLPEGSIILQQRLNKNNTTTSSTGSSIINTDTIQQNSSLSSLNNCGNSISVSNGGPFLLQTLKRLDKSQSILVFRNPNNNAATVLSSASIGTSTSNCSNNNNIINGQQTLSSVANLTGGTTLTLTTTSTNPIISGLTTTKSSINKNNNISTSSIALATATGFSQRITTTKSANININKNNTNNNNQNNNSNNNNNSGISNSRNQNGGGGNRGNNNCNNNNRLDDIQQDKSAETRSQQKQMNVPLGSNGEPIKLPDNLESLPRADHFPTQRHRWNTNEEIAAILISFDKHSEWQSKEVRTRPKSGSLLLYSRKKVRYRRDGYCWKKRKDGKTTREDHMKLKVQGTECIYGCYVHSAILPTFHRRCYWLLQNPDIVLVHYLNVPYPDDNKMAIITPSLSLWGDKKEWTKEELVSQLKPMFFSEDDPESGNDIEISTAETVEAIVSQLMEKQRLARQAALVKQLECGCPDSTCADGKSCAHPMRRIGGSAGGPSGNTKQDKQRQVENNNQVTSTTPNVLIGPRFYSRWVDRRNRVGGETDLKSSPIDNSTIQFQVIPSLHPGHTNSISNQHHQQQQQQQQQHHQHQQQQQQHILARQHNSNQLQQLSTNNNNNSSSTSTNSSVVRSNNQPIQQQQQQQQSSFTNASNQGNQINRITNNNISQIIINTNSNTNHNNGNSSSTAIFSNCISNGGNNIHNNNNNNTSTTTIITTNNNNNNNNSNNNNSSISSNNQLTSSHSNSHQQQQHHQQHQKISLQNTSDNNLTNDGSGNNNHHHHLHQNNLLMSTNGGGGVHPTSVNSSTSNTLSTSSAIVHHHHQQQQHHLHSQHHQQQQSQQQQQQQQQSIIDSNNIVNQRISSNLISNSSLGRSIGVSCPVTNNSVVNSAPPLVLNLSQISGSGNSLLILNGGQQQSFVCQTSSSSQQQHHRNNNSNMQQNLIPKIEKIETKPQHHFTDSVFDDITFATTASSNLGGADKHHQQNNLVKELNDSLPFFNETLDLSQEDIQKTLIANMPTAHTVVGTNGNNGGGVAGNDDIDSDINPMDFIDNVCDVDGVVGGTNNDLVIDDSNGCGVGLINDVQDPDDVFVNLDAFDMFVEFPELDLDGKTNFDTNLTDSKPSEQQLNIANVIAAGDISTGNCNNSQIGYNITDYSPEWAYPEGGVKVLVTGPWNSTSTYTVLFDAFPVKTTIVQDGVLRCFCPAHEVGLATLQVACDGIIISNSVIFEYKSPPNIEQAFEGAASESLYKFTLLNRLSSIDEKMQIKIEPKEIPEESALISQANFEERLVNYCQHLTNKVWRPISPRSWPISYKGMTLLHLASALGYTKLVCAMLTWRSDNPNLILETEIDALSRDITGFTPLAWACARGHCETAIILYKWNHNSLNIENNFRQNPLDLAKQNGYTQLIGELKRLEKLRINCQIKNQSSSLALNTFRKDTTPNNNNINNNNFNNNSNNNNSNSNNNLKNINKDNNNNNNNSNLTRTYDESSSNNSSPRDENSNSSSNASSTTTNCGGSSGNLHNNEENCKSETSNCSNRSHDGVFLRPGAVSSSQSPPSARISKRSSVDSGINMDIRAYSRSGKMFKDHNRFQSGLDSNDSFSLSMDSNNYLDNGIGMSSCGSGTLLSPMRKMDFALCEISASDTNCSIQDKQTGCSLSDDEDITDQNLKNDSVGVCVGESDAKVLTLAEHIIAAMPDRIKNESEDIMSLGSPMTESLNTDGINDAFMEPLLDSLPSSQFDHELNFEFSDNSYRYHDVSTPCSSLSPASSGPLQSPASYSILQEPTMNSPSPPPSAKELTEFLHASNMMSSSQLQRPFEADFSKLTLTDREQRELYEAAKCIQKAYRSYKGRKKLEEQDKERSAAIVIQNYYRRYKQFAFYKQMTHAALVIQNGYRSYCANKRFKKSQNHSITPIKQSVQDSQCLQNYYKNYQNDQQQQLQNQMIGGGTTSKEPSPSGPLKRTYSQRTQNQAARKIQQFMRQSKMKLQRERAEKERLVHQRREEYLQNLQFHGQQGIVTQEQNEK